jgi:predicted nucleotidyltransferase
LRCPSLDAFDDYYEKISGITFDEDTRENLLFEKAAGNREILSSRLVVLIVQEWSEETVRFCQLMNENDVSICVYVIQQNGSAINTTGMAHVSVTTIDVEQDLREVL